MGFGVTRATVARSGQCSSLLLSYRTRTAPPPPRPSHRAGQMVQLLLRAGAAPGHCWNKESTCPLYLAAREGHINVVELLIPRLSARQISRHCEEGTTPLGAAIRGAHGEVVDAVRAVHH